MGRLAAKLDANGNVIGTYAGRGPVAGVTCSGDVAAGESLIRLQGGIVKKKDVITFAGQPTQEYVALPVPFNERRGPDAADIKTRLRVTPDLVAGIAKGEAVTVVPPIPADTVEVTPAQYDQIAGNKHRPMDDKTPIWHLASDGVLTKNEGTRPKLRFAQTDVVADVGDVLAVALEIVSGDPLAVDTAFNRTLDLETNSGHFLRVQFTAGVGSLDINTSRPGKTTVRAMDALQVVEPLVVRVRSGSELRRE